MRTNIVLAFSLFFILVAINCKSEPPQPAQLVGFDEVCDPKYKEGRDANNRPVTHRVAYEGYLAFPQSAMLSDTMFLNVHKEPNRGGNFVLSSFKIGSKENRLEKPPKSFKDSDLKVIASDGTVLGHNAKVRVHGKRGGDGNSCYVSVELVEVVK